MSDERKWIVILWEYGRNNDEFEVNKVIGPFTFKKALEFEIEMEASCIHTKIAQIEGRIDSGI